MVAYGKHTPSLFAGSDSDSISSDVNEAWEAVSNRLTQNEYEVPPHDTTRVFVAKGKVFANFSISGKRVKEKFHSQQTLCIAYTSA
jgi:hypothetical protein